ncbi:MAG: SIR2 family protein [Bacteroides sp.]|nr:SIR2 family protein [Bacteroides sp.]
MNVELKRFATVFAKDIINENAAIFAGAGLSAPSGIVNWKELLREIAIELNLSVDRETDLIAIAQYYENNKGGRGKINDTLIEAFTREAEINENQRILASLPITTYWTTNYDELIEKSLDEVGKIVDVKKCVQNLAINKPKKDAIVYKMHGDISLPHEAVITKDDYESYNDKRLLFTTKLQGDLVSKTFLFIGFSFDDPNLEYILSRIRILLGENKRDHYCFLRRIQQSDFALKDDYIYECTKQELKIKDLKRYSIQAILIDDYSEVTETLLLIKNKIERRNIFISGAAHEYGKWTSERANELIFNLSKKLAEKDCKIISGFGLGIGSSVINGVLSFVFNRKKLHIDDYLILRPFPQNIKDEDERKRMWKSYREEMLSNAGIALFFFGNKIKNEELELSDGLKEEFEIAVKQNVLVIPIGCTGYMSKE